MTAKYLYKNGNMQEGFAKILALVDFSGSSLHAAEEAAMIASKFNSELDLLHVLPNPNVTYFTTPETQLFEIAENDKDIVSDNKKRLLKIKKDLEGRFNVTIQIHEATGKLCRTVRDYCHELNIDLVVLGTSRKNWFNELFFSSKVKNIIRAVDCEVLCVYPESNAIKLKKIVLPIGKFVPKRKIKLAYELAKKFAANVHLISLNTNGTNLNSEETRILMTSYQYLKDITNIPIECRTVQGENLAKATLDYAENIGADLILVNAGSESDFRRPVLSKWAGNIVHHSSIPVLCVHATNEKTNNRQYRA